ncbi:MAG: hypothetical protein E6K96_09940 [Thaumarchaeota archaeon]|nr:MAG: hypothetical protein E6K96_09940 [Nitrososphaerota archaeon]
MALEETSVQPLAHLAAPTVRTFELVYSEGRTEVLLSAETVEDMKKYAELLSLVYGGMRFETADPRPGFLRRLPVIVGLTVCNQIEMNYERRNSPLARA